MEYFYRIHFNNGEKKDFTGKELTGKKLAFHDSFVLTDKFKEYIEVGCKQMGLNKTDIKTVTIAHVKKRGDLIEYNLLGNNPYFSDIYKNISEKETWEYNYNTEREVISTESIAYQEMRDYVLNGLKNNPEVFLNDIYKYPNKFKLMLEKYVKSYSSNNASEEDYHNTYELETAIRHHLTIYKIYRNMAIKRYKYEKYNSYTNLAKPKKEDKKLTLDDLKLSKKLIEEHYNKSDSVTHRTREYNEKYDEFIEPDEYGQMNGYTGGKVL